VRALLWAFLLALPALAQEEKSIWDLWVQGEEVYLATGEGVRVLDAALRDRGLLGGFPAYALAGDGERLYAAGDYGLHVLAPGTPPRVLARLSGFPARALAVEGGRAYLGGPAGLLIADLSGEPRALGQLRGFAVLGLAVAGDRVYLATDKGLAVADVSDPASPRLLAQVEAGPAYAVAVWEGYVYLATGEALLVYQAQGEGFQEVGRLPSLRVYRLGVRGGRLFAVGVGGLRVYALEDPSRPQLLAELSSLAYASFFLRDNLLWLAAPGGVFQYALDLPRLSLLASTGAEAPAPVVENPRFTGRYGAYASWVAGRLVYLATAEGLRILDAQDPDRPRVVGLVKGFTAYALWLSGDTLYVGCADGLRVFRVKGPGRLEQRLYLRQPPVYALWLLGDVLYLGTREGVVAAAWKGQVMEVRWRAPGKPVYAFAEREGYLYIAGADGLWALSPREGAKGLRLLLSGPAFTLAFREGYLYLGGPTGLRVLLLPSPLEARLVGSLPGFPVWYLSFFKERLYLLSEGGLYLLALEDPAAPRVVAQLSQALWAVFWWIGDRLFGLGSEGVYVTRLEGETLVWVGLLVRYSAQVEAPPPPPPPPPAPAKGWYGTHWVKTWAAAPLFFYRPPTQPLALAVDSKGFVYVAGSTSGSLLGQAHAGEEDAFLAKFDPSGKLLWVRQFGSPLGDGIFALATDKSGNVYAAGHTLGSLGGPNQGSWDVFLAKFDPNGKRLFLKQYGTRNWDKVTGLGIDSAGNLYVGGFTYGAFPGQSNQGDRDYFLLKLDGNGKLLWARQGGSYGGEVTLGLAVEPGGAAYLVGQTDGVLPGQKGQGGTDIFVVKYDPTGKLLWARQLGTPADDRGQSAAFGGGALYVAGTTGGSFTGSGLGTKAFLLRLSPQGNLVWAREFGVQVIEGQGVISGSAYVALGPNGRVYLADSAKGDLPGYLGAGGADVFVLEYDAQGNLLSVLQSGTEEDDLAYALGVGPKGEVYVAGSKGSEAFLMKPKTPLPRYVGR